MFAIHYYNENSIVAIEGPVASMSAAKDYLAQRSHYLQFRPRVLSMNNLRNHAGTAGPENAFVIHYLHENSIVAIEGPVASFKEANEYLAGRSHYLEFRPRALSLSPLRHLAPTANTLREELAETA
jgi:hypothetical protein